MRSAAIVAMHIPTPMLGCGSKTEPVQTPMAWCWVQTTSRNSLQWHDCGHAPMGAYAALRKLIGCHTKAISVQLAWDPFPESAAGIVANWYALFIFVDSCYAVSHSCWCAAVARKAVRSRMILWFSAPALVRPIVMGAIDQCTMV